MMLEHRNAVTLVKTISDQSVYAYWAPGDYTLYRVALIKLVAYGIESVDSNYDFTALLAMIGMKSGHVDPHLILQKPRNSGEYWTAERFAREFGEEYVGWWAGLRPILAALEWTPANKRGVFYSASDTNVIAELVSTVGRVEY